MVTTRFIIGRPRLQDSSAAINGDFRVTATGADTADDISELTVFWGETIGNEATSKSHAVPTHGE